MKKYLYNGKLYTYDQLSEAAKASGKDVNAYISTIGATEVEDQYSYNGKTFSADQMLEAATASGKPFNEYVASIKAGVKKKEPTASLGLVGGKTGEDASIPGTKNTSPSKSSLVSGLDSVATAETEVFPTRVEADADTSDQIGSAFDNVNSGIKAALAKMPAKKKTPPGIPELVLSPFGEPDKPFSLKPTPELNQLYEAVKGVSAEEELKSANDIYGRAKVGIISPDGRELQSLAASANGKRYFNFIVDTLAPELKQDDESKYDYEQLAKGIISKYRKNGVANYDAFNTEQDQQLSSIIANSKAYSYSVGGGTGGAGFSQSSFQLPAIDLNDRAQISDLIMRMQNVNDLTDQEGKIKKGEKDRLITLLQDKLKRIDKPIAPEIAALSDKIAAATLRVSMDAELGEDTEATAQRDEANKRNFEAGLNWVQDVDPGMYQNVMRAIREKEKVPDINYRYLSRVGQEINNAKYFREGAVNPDAIGKETDFDYMTRQDKKSIYASAIGEYLKGQGYKNTRQYNPETIRKAAATLGLNNKSIVDELAAEEGMLFYDAIPKTGGREAFFRGVMQPIEALRKTGEVITSDDTDIYLRSQQYDVGLGGQKVPGKEGQMTNRLQSDQGNIWYDALEGFGQFIPQVVLARGIGSPLVSAARVGASTVPRAALTTAQEAAIVNYGGTFISTYLQEYGSSYEDALKKTGDGNRARAMGAINGIAAASFELFLPDTKIASDAAKLFRENYAGTIINHIKRGAKPEELARTGRNMVEKFVGKTLGIAGQEVKEEVATNITNFITEAIFSPRTADQRNLGEEIMETAKATAVSMSIPALLGGAGGSRSKDFTVQGLHAAAINFDGYQKALEHAQINDQISEGEYNQAIQALETHRESIRNSPKESSVGKKLSTSERMEYAYQETLIKSYNDQAQKSSSEVAKEDLKVKINNAQNIQREILGIAQGDQTGDQSWRSRVVPIEEQDRPADQLTKQEADSRLLNSLREKAAEFEKPEGLQYFIDQAAAAPQQFYDKYGKEVVDQLLDNVSTETLKANRDSLMKIGDPTNPNMDRLNKILDERGVDETISVKEVMDMPVMYKGQPGKLFQDGQSIVFAVDDSNREYELGNVNEIGGQSIKDWDIDQIPSPEQKVETPKQTVVDTDELGNIVVRGKPYFNNYSDPIAAINRDEDGNVVSVNLENEDGKKRTFRGDVAEDIAYQITLKQLEDETAAAAFEQFVGADESIQQEIVAAEDEVAAAQETVGDNAEVQREQIQPKPRVRVTAQQVEAGQLGNVSAKDVFPASKVQIPVYHGSDNKFDEFDDEQIGKRDVGFYGKGIYFSTNISDAEKFTTKSEAILNGYVGEYLVDIQNPLQLDVKDRSWAGKEIPSENDGVIVTDNGRVVEVMVKNKSQISKSQKKGGQNAVQEQSATESVLRDEGVREEGGLQEVERNDQPEVAAQESQPQQEVATVSEVIAGVKEKGVLTLTASQWANIVKGNFKDVPHLSPDAEQVQSVKKSIEEKGFTQDDNLRAKMNENGDIAIIDGNHRLVALDLIDPNKLVTIPVEFVTGEITIDAAGRKLKSPSTNIGNIISKPNEQKINKEPAPATEEDIEEFADRMVDGEKMTAPEDIQFYDNNKKAIEAELKRRQEAAKEGKGEFSQKLRDLASQIRKEGLPVVFPGIKLRADLPEGTQTQGFTQRGVENAIARALELIADVYDKTKDLGGAIAKGFQKVKKYYDKYNEPYDETKLSALFERQVEAYFNAIKPATKEEPQTSGKTNYFKDRDLPLTDEQKEFLSKDTMETASGQGIVQPFVYDVATLDGFYEAGQRWMADAKRDFADDAAHYAERLRDDVSNMRGRPAVQAVAMASLINSVDNDLRFKKLTNGETARLRSVRNDLEMMIAKNARESSLALNAQRLLFKLYHGSYKTGDTMSQLVGEDVYEEAEEFVLKMRKGSTDISEQARSQHRNKKSAADKPRKEQPRKGRSSKFFAKALGARGGEQLKELKKQIAEMANKINCGQTK